MENGNRTRGRYIRNIIFLKKGEIIKMFGFFSFLKKGPRLSFISQLKRKNKSDDALRSLLYTLSTPEYEESFTDCGFPPDDGRREFLPHEADDKLAFYCDRYWENAGQYKYRIESAASPEVFFKNFDLYVETLKNLSRFEFYVQFDQPFPTAILAKLVRDEGKLQNAMLNRAWNTALRKVERLKTETARKKALDDFFAYTETYRERWKEPAIQELEKFSQEKNLAIQNEIRAPERPKPVFDASEERSLLLEYRNAKDAMKKHFARLPLIRFYYKYRHDEKYLEKCERLCLEDIEELPKLDKIARQEAARVYQMSDKSASQKRRYEEESKRGFVGTIPAFDKLIMINLNRGDYQKALEYCDIAIRHSKEHAYAGGEAISMKPYMEKKERIQKKAEKART